MKINIDLSNTELTNALNHFTSQAEKIASLESELAAMRVKYYDKGDEVSSLKEKVRFLESSPPAPSVPTSPVINVPNLVQALRTAGCHIGEGQKINAIKVMRNESGLGFGLREAKEFVETYFGPGY
jgi:hypothetical protein